MDKVEALILWHWYRTSRLGSEIDHVETSTFSGTVAELQAELKVIGKHAGNAPAVFYRRFPQQVILLSTVPIAK